LLNCHRLGFDTDLEHQNYDIAHETIVRDESKPAMGPMTFSVFAFLNRISSRAPDFFQIPQDAIIEVGFRVQI
jgi:KUP system potassium uptake protein